MSCVQQSAVKETFRINWKTFPQLDRVIYFLEQSKTKFSKQIDLSSSVFSSVDPAPGLHLLFWWNDQMCCRTGHFLAFINNICSVFRKMCIAVQKIVMKVNPFGVLVVVLLVGRRIFLWKLSCMKDSESFTIFSQPIVLTLS